MTLIFYAVATVLLAIIAIAVIPTGGWGGLANAARIAVLAAAAFGLVVFLGALLMGRDRLGD